MMSLAVSSPNLLILYSDLEVLPIIPFHLFVSYVEKNVYVFMYQVFNSPKDENTLHFTRDLS